MSESELMQVAATVGVVALSLVCLWAIWDNRHDLPEDSIERDLRERANRINQRLEHDEAEYRAFESKARAMRGE